MQKKWLEHTKKNTNLPYVHKKPKHMILSVSKWCYQIFNLCGS